MIKDKIFKMGSDEWYVSARDFWKQAVLAALQGGQDASEALRSADCVLDAFNQDWTREE